MLEEIDIQTLHNVYVCQNITWYPLIYAILCCIYIYILKYIYFKIYLKWKSVWRLLKKLKIELPYGPSIYLLGIYPRGL
jgi:hypothetical protein